MGHNSRDRQNCRRKIRHPHYLSALLHARKLRQDENLTIYPCRVCQRLHVGHSEMKKKPVAYTTLWEKKKIRLERRIANVQQQLAQLQLNLQHLLASPPQIWEQGRPPQDT